MEVTGHFMACLSQEEIRIMKKIFNTLALFTFILFITACSKEDENSSNTTNKNVDVIDAVAVDSSKKIDSSKKDKDSSKKVEIVTNQDKPESKSKVVENTSASYAGRELKVLDISERSYDGGNAITVTFSIPLDTSKKISEYFLLTVVQVVML